GRFRETTEENEILVQIEIGANELYTNVNRSPLYGEVMDTYHWLKDAMEKYSKLRHKHLNRRGRDSGNQGAN
ncbi:unnamed protein product, partial [marine sediment metagenome]